MKGLHPSHVTRISMDASTYDEICVNCGATDEVPGGWGRLAEPCPNPPEKIMATQTLSEKQKALAAFEKRKANPPQQIDNSSLYAGSPMYYYCRMCGHQSDVLPESHLARPRQLCIDCQLIKDMGWFD